MWARAGPFLLSFIATGFTYPKSRTLDGWVILRCLSVLANKLLLSLVLPKKPRRIGASDGDSQLSPRWSLRHLLFSKDFLLLTLKDWGGVLQRVILWIRLPAIQGFRDPPSTSALLRFLQTRKLDSAAPLQTWVDRRGGYTPFFMCTQPN